MDASEGKNVMNTYVLPIMWCLQNDHLIFNLFIPTTRQNGCIILTFLYSWRIENVEYPISEWPNKLLKDDWVILDMGNGKAFSVILGEIREQFSRVVEMFVNIHSVDLMALGVIVHNLNPISQQFDLLRKYFLPVLRLLVESR